MSTEVRESVTYAKGGRNSYFHDLGRVSLGIEDPGALARLRSHAEEMESGADGYHVLPTWMQEALAETPRGYLGLAPAIHLPYGADNIKIPNGDDVVNAPVVTLSGQQGVKFRQLHRGSPAQFDEVIFQDLRLDYHAKVAGLVISGRERVRGVRKTLGIASLVAPAFGASMYRNKSAYHLIGEAVEGISGASAVAMHPRRWAALRASFDGTVVKLPRDERPSWAVGEMHGVPVATDSMIPTDLGDNGDEDAVQVLRIEDLRRFASDVYPRVTVSKDGDPVFQIFGYHAFTAELNPGNIVDISGPGLSKPEFG